MNTENQINVLANILYSKFGIKKIFLFGSYADGTQTIDSDLDFCLITNLLGNRKIDLLHKIRREIINEISEPVDLLLYDEKEFYDRAKIINSLEYKILNNGISINE